MKRPLIALIIIIIALTLVACDADDEVYETYEPEIEDEITERNVEPAPGLMTEYFLQDLDYMLHTLENNFALFDVAYWARGVDIPAIAKNIRAEILANPEMSVEEFYRALTRNFGPLTGIAHFMFINPPTIQYFIDNPWSPALTRVVSSEPLTLPHVLDFYESMASTPEQPYTRTLTERGIRHIVKRSILYGERELAEEMMESFRSGDYEGVMMLLDSFFEITSNIPNVRTEVIEENRIAYLSIDSFSSYLLATWPEEEAQILNFLGEIRDFDHLIIDLRRNQGGDPFYFIDAVMGPNVETQMMAYGFGFMIVGEYSSPIIGPGSMLNRQRFSRLSQLDARDDTLRTVSDMLEDFEIPDINMDDMERIDYGFRTRITINPRRLPQFDNQPAFTGKIWVLTSTINSSATTIVPWIVRETGFATLVGETTGGNYGGPETFVALPNTGILFRVDLFYITDINGRPLEAGIEPHYFNRDGMDALETTLALIAEGS